jgi:UDP-3-O-[3-hydroxymyristoyl] glucosamine N-acyltransferase
MAISAAEMAKKLGGTAEGDGTAAITGAAGVQEAGPGDLTFLARAKYASAVETTKASAIIVSEDFKGKAPCTVIRVKDADKAFVAAVALLAPPPVDYPRGVHPTAVVARDAKLGRDVSVGPCCVLEPGVAVGDRTVLVAGCYLGHGTTVGADCRFYPHVTVREHTRIGNRVILHNGAVIGSDGFGYTKEGKAWKKIPQVGTVEIGDDVEIGANVTVDRARFGKTVIGNGVKIDNLVQIAHNVRVGENTAMAAQVGIAGSTVIGRNVQLAGQAGVTGHVTVGDDAIVGGGAAVLKDVEPGTFVSGYPAMPHSKAKRIHAHVMMLPQLREKLQALEKKIEELEEKLKG